MAAHDRARWHPPLKAPSIDIVDLLSDSDSADTPPRTSPHKAEHDAYGTISRAQEGDVQWHGPLKAPAIEFDDPLSRDAGTGMEMSKVLTKGDDAEGLDASAEGSDSDEDSQWSLYEDALGRDEDEMALHASM